MKKYKISNKKVLNILSKFVPHETIAFNDKDTPWFNDKILELSLPSKNITGGQQIH